VKHADNWLKNVLLYWPKVFCLKPPPNNKLRDSGRGGIVNFPTAPCVISFLYQMFHRGFVCMRLMWLCFAIAADRRLCRALGSGGQAQSPPTILGSNPWNNIISHNLEKQHTALFVRRLQHNAVTTLGHVGAVTF